MKITALKRIDEADLALGQFERMLTEKGVELHRTLTEIITSTPFWHPFEQHRLSQIRKSFHAFSDSVYGATDDIAALVRCHDNVADMGISVVESANTKHQLLDDILNAPSLGAAIERLRDELKRQKEILTSV